MLVLGQTIDKHTRCVHYSSPLDIIAIKFNCCDQYYPCYQCHPTSHPIVRYARTSSTPVVLCGNCDTELTFSEYSKDLRCPTCSSAFNPGCKSHYDIYFE